ncbi:MAG: hypothetical protein R2834_07350 [Rhodothermales bacterium]
MHVLLDHISSIIVATILFVSLIAVVNRNRQNSVEMQIGQIIEKQAFEFARTVERDLENIRSKEQTQLSLGRPEECLIERDGTGNTTRIIFPTLEDPSAGAASSIVHVEYRLIPDDTTTIAVDGANVQVYRIERRRKINDLTFVDDGGSGNFITRFDVGMIEEGALSAPTGSLIDICPDELDRIHIEFQAAIPTIDKRSSDQRSTSNLNIVRYGNTIYSHNR